MVLKTLAQTSVPLPTLEGLGPLGQELSPGSYTYFTDIGVLGGIFEIVLSVTVGVMTVIGGIWFIFNIMSAALQWLMGGGNKESIQAAQKRLVNSLIGLVLVVASYGLILAVGNILGLGRLLNPGYIISNYLTP